MARFLEQNAAVALQKLTGAEEGSGVSTSFEPEVSRSSTRSKGHGGRTTSTEART
jgi:hypothetical protein